MEVGEACRGQVELAREDGLRDGAPAVVFDGVLRRPPTTQHAPVLWSIALLEPSVCAPTVPQGAEDCCAYPRWHEFVEHLEVGDSLPRLPGGGVLSDAGTRGWGIFRMVV